MYELLNEGTLTAVKIGRRTFIRADELERYVASLPGYRPGPVVLKSGEGAETCPK